MAYTLKHAFRIIPVAVALLACLDSVSAGEPVAIVESISVENGSLASMTYLEEGQVIQLKAEESLTLGYLFSCWVETIRGGRVVVGREQSRVENGEVRRERVNCDRSGLRLTPEQSAMSAVIVFRRPPEGLGGEVSAADFILYGTNPAARQ